MKDVAKIEGGPRLRRFKSYSAYKDSGVEWLGEIPAHWSNARISELTTLLNGHPFDSEYFVRGEGIPLVRIRDLEAVETEVNYVGPVVEVAWIQRGDVIIGMDGDFNVARWRGERALLNQRLCCLRPRGETESGFVAYLLPLPLEFINALTYSTTVRHLSSIDVRKIRLGAPPAPEQRAIAAFLDRETARIDALVAKKERLIGLLREKRSALITRAVTKGLDPNVPMKDSGVEWLGEIPASWEMKRLRHVSPSLGVGVVVNPSQYVVDEGLPYLYGSDVSEGRIHANNARRISEEDSRRLPKSQLRVHDLVMVRVGAPGVTAVVPAGLEGANCASLLVIRGHSGFSSSWLCYALNSRYVRSQVEVVQYGAAQEQFNVSHAVDFLIALPPLLIQAEIATYLNRETTLLYALVAKTREAIDRLKELRTALISAAVTGKIDVREEVA